jgi:hypothetical protein
MSVIAIHTQTHNLSTDELESKYIKYDDGFSYTGDSLLYE